MNIKDQVNKYLKQHTEYQKLINDHTLEEHINKMYKLVFALSDRVRTLEQRNSNSYRLPEEIFTGSFSGKRLDLRRLAIDNIEIVYVDNDPVDRRDYVFQSGMLNFNFYLDNYREIRIIFHPEAITRRV